MHDRLRENARVAGLLYLVVVLLGPFVLLYVPGKILVPGDAPATVANLLAQESLFRIGIAAGIVSQVFFILSVLALYRLFQHVDRQLAVVMAVLILAQIPLGILGTAVQVSTLNLARGGEILAGFEGAQRDDLVLLLMHADGKGVLVSQVYWGLWLIPLALLAIRSGFIPRILGVWLFANGIAYVAMSGASLFLAEHANTVRTVAMPLLFGEMALMVWLLILGWKRAPASAGAA